MLRLVRDQRVGTTRMVLIAQGHRVGGLAATARPRHMPRRGTVSGGSQLRLAPGTCLHPWVAATAPHGFLLVQVPLGAPPSPPFSLPPPQVPILVLTRWDGRGHGRLYIYTYIYIHISGNRCRESNVIKIRSPLSKCIYIYISEFI